MTLKEINFKRGSIENKINKAGNKRTAFFTRDYISMHVGECPIIVTIKLKDLLYNNKFAFAYIANPDRLDYFKLNK